MSLFGPRGRHRAPSKISITASNSARATAALAAAGGIAATAAAPQAHAEGVASMSKLGGVAAQPVDGLAAPAAGTALSATDVQALLGALATANPQLSTVNAKTLVVQAPKQDTTTTTTTAATTTSRSTSRPAATTTRSATTTTRSTNNSSATTTRSSSGSSSTGTSRSSSGSSSTSVPASSSAAVAIAKRYLGVPYVYGGSSPSGFDCSGLTQYVYAQLGKSLARSAAAQQATVRSVSNPQPGDLVFFGYPAHHVGIYVGNGMMIAAPYPGQVVRLQPIYDTPSGYGRP